MDKNEEKKKKTIPERIKDKFIDKSIEAGVVVTLAYGWSKVKDPRTIRTFGRILTGK